MAKNQLTELKADYSLLYRAEAALRKEHLVQGDLLAARTAKITALEGDVTALKEALKAAQEALLTLQAKRVAEAKEYAAALYAAQAPTEPQLGDPALDAVATAIEVVAAAAAVVTPIACPECGGNDLDGHARQCSLARPA